MSQLDNILEKLRKVSQDPDVDDKKGTQPKKYYSGVDKDKKDSRDAHFKKGASMSDDNPNAYKPAPGDKDKEGKMKKTKPSKHTDKFKQMYGEAVSPAQQAAIAIAKQKSGKYDKDGKKLEKEACWDGYKQVGLKKKGKKMVPDCVPEEVVNEKDMTAISTWKKNIKKVKGLSKDTLQQLLMLPTPVITSLVNQIGMIVSQYNEELDKDSDAGDYIDDFRKSDAPQFKGKSDKKIRKMAIAAYLDKKEK